MKIGILTWSKAINHGAILQTYALQKFLERDNHKVVELDYKFSEENKYVNKSFKLKKILKKINSNYIFSKLKLNNWIMLKKRLFEDFKNSYMCYGKMYDEEQNLKKVIIGSDMVFDFHEGYNPYMYGKNVYCNYIFSYAACFGYTTPEIFEAYEKKDEIITYLRRLKGISYRDNNTGNILKSYCKIDNCIKTLDPVLLYGFGKEKNNWNNYGWAKRNYILIYSYTFNMDSPIEIKSIKKYAKKNNLEIISVGYYHRWCDSSVNADPKEFVEMFANANYIITDTFHGTVFSIVFNKPFLPIIRNNSFKIIDLLDEIGLSDVICRNIETDINKLSNNYDYLKVNKKLEKMRKKSYDYLIYHINN